MTEHRSLLYYIFLFDKIEHPPPRPPLPPWKHEKSPPERESPEEDEYFSKNKIF